MSSNVSVTIKDIFTTYEVSRIHAIERFIVNMSDRQIARAAAKLGYNTEEHDLGWKDWATAAGMHVPFTHHLSTNELRLMGTDGGTLLALIHDVDQFENRWFPRARTTIRRFVASDKREAYEAAFFEDMAQQPEGPGVIPSVEKFLSRFEAMAKSNVKGVPDAYDALVSRGLSKAVVKQMKEMIAEAKRQQEPLPAPKVDSVAIETSATQRRDAYDRVNRWYNDWAETFRSELSYRYQVRLGLIEVKGGKKGTAEEPEAPTEGGNV